MRTLHRKEIILHSCCINEDRPSFAVVMLQPVSQRLRETKVSLSLMLRVYVGPSRGSAQHYLRKSSYYPLALQTPALVVRILPKRSRMRTAVVILVGDLVFKFANSLYNLTFAKVVSYTLSLRIPSFSSHFINLFS